MNKDLLNKFRKNFIEQRNAINKSITSNEDNELDVDGDDIDLASCNVLGKIAQNLSMRQLDRLKRIEAAIQRIDDGTFGECEECGSDITEKRLFAKPDAVTCISCAEKLEYKLKQFG